MEPAPLVANLQESSNESGLCTLLSLCDLLNRQLLLLIGWAKQIPGKISPYLIMLWWSGQIWITAALHLPRRLFKPLIGRPNVFTTEQLDGSAAGRRGLAVTEYKREGACVCSEPAADWGSVSSRGIVQSVWGSASSEPEVPADAVEWWGGSDTKGHRPRQLRYTPHYYSVHTAAQCWQLYWPWLYVCVCVHAYFVRSKKWCFIWSHLLLFVLITFYEWYRTVDLNSTVLNPHE